MNRGGFHSGIVQDMINSGLIESRILGIRLDGNKAEAQFGGYSENAINIDYVGIQYLTNWTFALDNTTYGTEQLISKGDTAVIALHYPYLVMRLGKKHRRFCRCRTEAEKFAE